MQTIEQKRAAGAAFGKRGGSIHASARAGLPVNRGGGAVQRVTPLPAGLGSRPFFRANYGYAFSWLGLVAFGAVGSLIYDHVIAPDDLAKITIPIDGFILWSVALIGTAVGVFSLWHGLMGSPALILDGDGVTGYNLYGRTHVAWADIDYLTSQNSKHYGRTVEIRSKNRLFGIIPHGVSYSPKLADKSADEVIAALRLHRPDL